MDFNHNSTSLPHHCVIFDVFISTYRFEIQAKILPRWQTQKHAYHQGEDIGVYVYDSI